MQTVLSIVRGRELVVLGEGVHMFYVPLPSSLVGKTIAQANIGARTGLNVIAIQRDGRVVTNPQPGGKLMQGSELVALGTTAQRERFATVFD